MKMLITQYNTIINTNNINAIEINLEKYDEPTPFYNLEIIVTYNRIKNSYEWEWDYLISIHSKGEDGISPWLFLDAIKDKDKAQKYIATVISRKLATQNIITSDEVIEALRIAINRGDF